MELSDKRKETDQSTGQELSEVKEGSMIHINDFSTPQKLSPGNFEERERQEMSANKTSANSSLQVSEEKSKFDIKGNFMERLKLSEEETGENV